MVEPAGRPEPIAGEASAATTTVVVEPETPPDSITPAPPGLVPEGWSGEERLVWQAGASDYLPPEAGDDLVVQLYSATEFFEIVPHDDAESARNRFEALRTADLAPIEGLSDAVQDEWGVQILLRGRYLIIAYWQPSEDLDRLLEHLDATT